MKLIPGKKTIIVIVIAIIIILAYFATTSAYDWDEGAPEADILCSIQAVGTGDSFTGDVSITQKSELTQMLETNPMTTFTSDIATLDANTQYTISFSAAMTTKTAKFGEALTNSIVVTGITGGSKAGNNYLTVGDIAFSSDTVVGTAGSSSTLSISGFAKHEYIPSAIVIMGDVIDGSVFTFVITSEAADGRTSSTTATLSMNVDSGGTIYLTIDSITTVVSTIEGYPFVEGWDVIGDIHHIVVGQTITYYHSQTTGTTMVIYLNIDDPALPTTLFGAYDSGIITQQQYDCGIAQINAYGG